MKQKTKSRLSGDSGKTVNRIVSERNILAQNEFKNKHDWVGKVIHWELFKRLKIDYTNIKYSNQNLFFENETYKILRNFEIQTDSPIPSKGPDSVLISKKKITF